MGIVLSLCSEVFAVQGEREDDRVDEDSWMAIGEIPMENKDEVPTAAWEFEFSESTKNKYRESKESESTQPKDGKPSLKQFLPAFGKNGQTSRKAEKNEPSSSRSDVVSKDLSALPKCVIKGGRRMKMSRLAWRKRFRVRNENPTGVQASLCEAVPESESQCPKPGDFDDKDKQEAKRRSKSQRSKRRARRKKLKYNHLQPILESSDLVLEIREGDDPPPPAGEIPQSPKPGGDVEDHQAEDRGSCAKQEKDQVVPPSEETVRELPTIDQSHSTGVTERAAEPGSVVDEDPRVNEESEESRLGSKMLRIRPVSDEITQGPSQSTIAKIVDENPSTGKDDAEMANSGKEEHLEEIDEKKKAKEKAAEKRKMNCRKAKKAKRMKEKKKNKEKGEKKKKVKKRKQKVGSFDVATKGPNELTSSQSQEGPSNEMKAEQTPVLKTVKRNISQQVQRLSPHGKNSPKVLPVAVEASRVAAATKASNPVPRELYSDQVYKIFEGKAQRAQSYVDVLSVEHEEECIQEGWEFRSKLTADETRVLAREAGSRSSKWSRLKFWKTKRSRVVKLDKAECKKGCWDESLGKGHDEKRKWSKVKIVNIAAPVTKRTDAPRRNNEGLTSGEQPEVSLADKPKDYCLEPRTEEMRRTRGILRGILKVPKPCDESRGTAKEMRLPNDGHRGAPKKVRWQSDLVVQGDLCFRSNICQEPPKACVAAGDA